MDNIWLYARQRSCPMELQRQANALYRLAAERGQTVVGISADREDAPLFRRPGLREVFRQVRRGRIQAVLVTRLTNISHDDRLLLRLLKTMQVHRVKLEAGHTQLAYELHVHGLDRPLCRRAARFDGFLPY